jgi:intracellular sulfur oxidation DsrE/DsrF family protein
MKKMTAILSIALLLCMTILEANETEEKSKKVVYNLTTGDITHLEKSLIGGIISHTTYYQSKLQELEVRVIIHGDAYKFFMKDLNNTAYAYQPNLIAKKSSLEKRLTTLAKQYNVTFFVCEIGATHRKLNKKAFYPFVSMVHNAAIGLIDAQNDGYAYLAIE